MVRLDEIFEIKYGNQFDLSKMELSNGTDGIHFISRDSNNNGCVAFVKKHKDIEPYKPGLLTVTMGGSYLLSSFVQVHEFYTAQNIKVLKPKTEMSLEEKLLYCAIIQHNRFRYHSHAREANSTFDSILVPKLDELKNKFDLNGFNKEYLPITPLSSERLQLNTKEWKWFKYDEIFEICKGFYNKKPEENVNGEIPFIGATDSNNGITSFHDLETIEMSSKTGQAPNAPLSQKMFPENCITVSNNGSVGYAFYQNKKFTCTHDVNPLYLKGRTMNEYIAMFLCTIIEKERFRWAYGRKWRPVRMPASLIKLPAKKNTDNKYEPDWQWMEDYIKGLPYSGCL